MSTRVTCAGCGGSIHPGKCPEPKPKSKPKKEKK